MEVSKFVLAAVFVFLAAGANVALHELAHAAAAWMLRFRILEIRIGSVPQLWSRQFRRVRVVIGLLPFTGMVLALPRSLRFFRLRMMIFAASGPLANGLLLLLGIHWLGEHDLVGPDSWSTTAAIMLTLFSGFFLATSLWPSRRVRFGNTIESDGRLLFTLPFYRRERMAEWIHGFHLHYGVRLAMEGDAKKGARWIKRGIRSLDLDVAAMWWLSLAHHESEAGNIDAARDIYLRLLGSPKITDGSQIRHDAADGLACLSLFYDRKDLLEEGHSAIVQAMAEHPTSITLKGTLGSILLERGEMAEARALLSEVMENSTSALDRGISAAGLAVIAFREDEPDESASLAEVARTNAGDHRFVIRLLGLLPPDQPSASGTSK